MIERLNQRQIENAEDHSRRFEKFWRIFTYPGKYSLEEASEAWGFFEKEGKKIIESVGRGRSLEILNLLNSVSLGLFHRNIIVPPELRPEPPNTN